MKISKEALKEIIKEELEALSEQDQPDSDSQKSSEPGFGKQTASRGQSSANLKQRAKDMASQKGIDDKERGIINQIENLLSQLADATDIKSGAVGSNLKRLYNLLKKELGDQ